MTTDTITTTLREMAAKLGTNVADYGTFPGSTEVTIHRYGAALALDGGQAVDLEDGAKIRTAYADDFATIDDEDEAQIEEGGRVESGTGGDYDTGVVHEIEAGKARVGWDSGVETWQPVELLTAI